MSSSSERVFTFRFAGLVVTVGLCYFMALGILLPVVPVFVKHDLGGNDIVVGVVVGAFVVGVVLIRPFTGRLGDRVGRRILIVVGGAIVGSAWVSPPARLFRGAGSCSCVVGGIGEAAFFFVGAASMITDLCLNHDAAKRSATGRSPSMGGWHSGRCSATCSSVTITSTAYG